MNIIILSRKAGLYSTKRIIEAGRERGHKMFVLDHLKCNILIEKDRPQIIYRKINVKNIHAIIPRIGASVNFHGAAVIQQFEMMNVFTSTGSEALLRARNKLKSLQLLSKSGLELPKTVFTNYGENVDEVLDAVGGAPVIIKLLEGTQGLGVVLAEDRTTAASFIQAFYQLKARIIVQEFIKEARGSDIRAFVVDGQVVASMKRTAEAGEFRSNLHRGGSAKLFNLSSREEETAVKAAEVMGLGIAGVDLLPSDRGPLILEVNPSPGLEGIEGITGVNIAGKILEYIENNVKT